jgi:hypothetical protein
MRQGALVLSIMLGVVATPAMADPPNIEDADHITGCLDRGRLLSFEVSGWGAYKPCFKHRPEAEWITLQRANQNSRSFTIRPSAGEAVGILQEGPVPPGVPLTEIVTVGDFTLYGSPEYCTVAVGPSEAGGVIVYAETPAEGLTTPYAVDMQFGDVQLIYGASRYGAHDEVFYGATRGDVLGVRPVFTFASVSNCSGAVTFDYVETPEVHTIYDYNRELDDVTIEYRKED